MKLIGVISLVLSLFFVTSAEAQKNESPEIQGNDETFDSSKAPETIRIYTDAFWMIVMNYMELAYDEKFVSEEGNAVYFNLGVEFPTSEYHDINIEFTKYGDYFSFIGSYVWNSKSSRTGFSQKVDFGLVKYGNGADDCDSGEYSCSDPGGQGVKLIYNIRYSFDLNPVFITPEIGLGALTNSEIILPMPNWAVRLAYEF